MIRLERLAGLRAYPPHCLWTLGAPALDELDIASANDRSPATMGAAMKPRQKPLTTMAEPTTR